MLGHEERRAWRTERCPLSRNILGACFPPVQISKAQLCRPKAGAAIHSFIPSKSCPCAHTADVRGSVHLDSCCHGGHREEPADWVGEPRCHHEPHRSREEPGREAVGLMAFKGSPTLDCRHSSRCGCMSPIARAGETHS